MKHSCFHTRSCIWGLQHTSKWTNLYKKIVIAKQVVRNTQKYICCICLVFSCIFLYLITLLFYIVDHIINVYKRLKHLCFLFFSNRLVMLFPSSVLHNWKPNSQPTKSYFKNSTMESYFRILRCKRLRLQRPTVIPTCYPGVSTPTPSRWDFEPKIENVTI